MSERDGHEPGVPCWVASVEADPWGAASFYGELFGWDTDTFDTGGGQIALWRVPGYVGGEPRQPVLRIGVAGPFEGPGFRRAVLADPQGAAFTVSQLMIASQGA
jgi:uncharacterized protein